ncbi:NAD-P-binding protein [Trametes polyzona]|nr:NAD-P-binding protein [Trametes polyzona]
MSRQLVWFITGASTGFGLALTKRILARGDRVIATARDTSRFDPLLSHPDTDRDRIHVLELDITSPFAIVQGVAQKAADRWDRIDVLVNNAGVGGGAAPSEELSIDLIVQVMKTNYLGTINVTNAVLPHMRKRREGTVLIFGSRTAYRNEFLGPSAYAASKAAVHSYGETLSAEVAEFNIRVAIVVPGAFATGFAPPLAEPAPIPDYDRAREELRKRLEDRDHAPNQGDPAKGMDALMDVVKGEGKAAGKGKMPLWLFLGDDSLSDVKARASKLLRTADEWADVGTGLGQDDLA